MTLTSAEMLAIIAGGGSVSLPNGGIITRADQVPTQAQLDTGVLDRTFPTLPNAATIAASGGAIGSTYKSGMWTVSPNAASTAAPVNGQLTACPIYLPRSGSITDLAVEVVTTPGGAGALVRIGVYADDGTGYPGTLLVDAGTVDCTTTGVKTITLGAALSLPAGRFWLAAAVQGNPTPSPTMRIDQNTRSTGGILAATSTVALQSANTSYLQSAVTGALPATFTATPASTTYAIRTTAKLG